jgi:hypothetical protein
LYFLPGKNIGQSIGSANRIFVSDHGADASSFASSLPESLVLASNSQLWITFPGYYCILHDKKTISVSRGAPLPHRQGDRALASARPYIPGEVAKVGDWREARDGRRTRRGLQKNFRPRRTGGEAFQSARDSF